MVLLGIWRSLISLLCFGALDTAAWFVVHFIKFSIKRWLNQRADAKLREAGKTPPLVSLGELEYWEQHDIDKYPFEQSVEGTAASNRHQTTLSVANPAAAYVAK